MRRAATLTLLVAVLGTGAAPAGADVFGPLSLVSASPVQQADFARDPAISGDGRYVVFDGSVGGVTGVWRRELAAPGNLEQVAGGDALLPSVSGNGRYVSFTTNEGGELAEITNGLPNEPQHLGEAPNVYVRDMALAPDAPGAFQVVSAPNGSSEPLTYGSAGGGAAEELGSMAAGRSAISADGNEVVFVTTAVSNLARYPQLEQEEEENGESPRPHTPVLEVAVRNLLQHSTRIVSVRRDPETGRPALDPSTGLPEAVPTVGQGGSLYGAVATRGGPPRFRPSSAYQLTQTVGASISADGSTVAWMAQQLGAQVPLLGAETIPPEWAEPVWRRIADGEEAATRPVTGGSDPESPSCAASGEQRLPETPVAGDPCQGPFAIQLAQEQGAGGVYAGEESENGVPQLSGDGYEVAFLATAPPTALGAGAGGAGRHPDLYVADMHPGLTRAQATKPLTELASTDEQALRTNAPITDLAISADAQQVAFTTDRTVFPLGSPAFVSAPAAAAGMNEVYDVDLGNETLTRVTRGYEGGASEHPHEAVRAGVEDPYFFSFGIDDGALSPSLSADGLALAFSSTASNLVFGDNNTPASLQRGNLDGADAFVVGRITFAPQSTEQSISPAPPGPSPSVPWKIGLTAQSLRDGRVRLFAALPGPGTLRAQATGRIFTRGRHGPTTARRTVSGASVAATAPEPGYATLTLALGSRYKKLVARRKGLPATVAVTFVTPGHAVLRAHVNVVFARSAGHTGAKR